MARGIQIQFGIREWKNDLKTQLFESRADLASPAVSP